MKVRLSLGSFRDEKVKTERKTFSVPVFEGFADSPLMELCYKEELQELNDWLFEHVNRYLRPLNLGIAYEIEEEIEE